MHIYIYICVCVCVSELSLFGMHTCIRVFGVSVRACVNLSWFFVEVCTNGTSVHSPMTEGLDGGHSLLV